VIARAGEAPEVVLEATYGWGWMADELAEQGARVHLAHPLGAQGRAQPADSPTAKPVPSGRRSVRDLDVQTISHDPIAGHHALAAIVDPVLTPSNTRVAGMRLTDPRVQALLTSVLVFRLLPRGFTNRDLRNPTTRPRPDPRPRRPRKTRRPTVASRRAADAYDKALDQLLQHGGLAA
jgi:hypothetical protein